MIDDQPEKPGQGPIGPSLCRCIVVVDDERDMREILGAILRSLGFDVADSAPGRPRSNICFR